MTFLSLNQTYGWESIPDDLDAWPFRTVYLQQYGVSYFNIEGLMHLQNNLENDKDLFLDYLVSKLGYDP